MTGQLTALLDQHKAATGVSDAELARRIGITRQNLSLWRVNGLRRLPEREHLDAVATVTDRPYAVVLAAALHDTGYAGVGDRPYEVVYADTVRVLTEAARLTWPARRFIPDAGWVTDPDATPEPIDWAQFVAHALTAAAANVGGLDRALAGRPGSWEADGVRGLVTGTGGDDLAGRRTEPLQIVINPDQVLADLGYLAVYDASAQALVDERRQHVWVYTAVAEGWVPDSPDAPPPEPRPADIPLGSQMYVPRTDDDERALDELDDHENALHDLELDDIQRYGHRLRQTLIDHAHAAGIAVDVIIARDDRPTPASLDPDLDEKIAAAVLATPLPSGLLPEDYPDQKFADIDRAAERLPHQRARSRPPELAPRKPR
ncbi:hypothetical protein P0W64_21260 [Tsukamurella sp. 8F]|uniref:hypothetical protein n=1 Tax=unclassified Tsukamurella TaxID=2633480 RepID=UPI0023B9F569|nr:MULTISPECIES: hypothetical protein [unclassified Tsukamurella]MDF0532287.1 hypothetical protein [Tsukamurella sp. 8J]MDF0589313.1 hypothetical protein [Tsukamurella sp. 8F]